MLLKGAYCVGEHFVDPHGGSVADSLFYVRRQRSGIDTIKYHT